MFLCFLNWNLVFLITSKFYSAPCQIFISGYFSLNSLNIFLFISFTILSVYSSTNDEISKIDGLNVFPSKSNYMLIDIRETGFTAAELALELMKKGIIVRDCTSFKGLDEYWIRISICTLKEDEKFINILKEVLN